MTSVASIQVQAIWDLLKQVNDPEVPVLSITDLGIVRNVEIGDDEVLVTITPTYTGCPAVDAISMNIRLKLIEHGYRNVKIKQVLSPAWTTEWMSEAGRQKLKAYGIAPPNPMQQVCKPDLFQEDESVQCPRCNSYHTVMISRFGSTACKALYKCEDCHEPFDYFKCH
jgi:ring-1,2-phenylacetyl-CoA epoxidase subunit PaaD